MLKNELFWISISTSTIERRYMHQRRWQNQLTQGHAEFCINTILIYLTNPYPLTGHAHMPLAQHAVILH